MNRRDWLRVSVSGAAVALVSRRLGAQPMSSVADDLAAGAAPTRVTVYKSATCGCCKQWVAHMHANGFAVTANDVDAAKLQEVKDTFGVPQALRSCHTALVGPHVIEGHVPADVVKQMVAGRPKLVGLAVPGMPVGAPGMEMGARQDRYDVMAFDRGGRSWVFAKR